MGETSEPAIAPRPPTRAERRREERRKNLIALAIGFGIAVAAIAFCLRPATILGAGPSAVASSVSVKDLQEFGGARCTRRDGEYACTVPVPKNSGAMRVDYRVSLDSFGCWTATAERRVIDGVTADNLDGCITILDY